MLGSSPLSRGIRRRWRMSLCFSGIIPALAGNTQPEKPVLVQRRDHPRSRGEYKAVRIAGPNPSGSSPLSRGIHAGRRRASAAAGIIPALAGNTKAGPRCGGTPRDHPRSRGEYPDFLKEEKTVTGSSPLSRGIPAEGIRAAIAERIIPALAGNTANSLTVSTPPADHPRSRGEYWLRPCWTRWKGGSSPLSRGIPWWA